jgi:hypothetical protein
MFCISQTLLIIFCHHVESLFYGVMFIKLCSQKNKNKNYYIKHEGGNKLF